jgi:hypothetical protein
VVSRGRSQVPVTGCRAWGQARITGQARTAWAPRVFLRHTRIEEAQERPLVRKWRRWCSSTPPNHRPGQLAAHIALGITWGGLVGDRGHRKGQLRVLGSPSALRTKEPRTGGPPGGESADPILFCESPLIRTWGY